MSKSKNHIEKMKEKRFEAVDFYYNFFDTIREKKGQIYPIYLDIRGKKKNCYLIFTLKFYKIVKYLCVL